MRQSACGEGGRRSTTAAPWPRRSIAVRAPGGPVDPVAVAIDGDGLFPFALAAVGAILGGAIWYMVFIAVGAEIVWAGVVTGGLAGAGASVAARGRYMSLRIASACLAIGAIVAARYFLFLMLSLQRHRMPDGYRLIRFSDFFSGRDVLWITLTLCAAMGVSGFGRRHQV